MTRRQSYFMLAVSLVAALFCLVYPLYVIRPFRHQDPGELSFALRVLDWRGMITAAAVAISLLVLILSSRFFRSTRQRFAVATAVLVTVASAALSRVNVFEQMFHPLPGAPAFLSIANTHLDSDEKVLAVRVNGKARAYPVRNLAYHHVVNDTPGGQPIVATY